jgi:hypothetical protein
LSNKVINNTIAHLLLSDDDPNPLTIPSNILVFGVSGNHSRNHKIENVKWTKFGNAKTTSRHILSEGYENQWNQLVDTWHPNEAPTKWETTHYLLSRSPPHHQLNDVNKSVLTCLLYGEEGNFPFVGIFWEINGHSILLAAVYRGKRWGRPFGFVLEEFMFSQKWKGGFNLAYLRAAIMHTRNVRDRTLTGLLMEMVKNSLAPETTSLRVHDAWHPIGRSYTRKEVKAAAKAMQDIHRLRDAVTGINLRYARMVPDGRISKAEWVAGIASNPYYGVWGLDAQMYRKTKDLRTFNDWCV